VQRPEAALVVGRDRDGVEDALDLRVGEAVAGEALARVAGDDLLRARARGHALGGDADEPARAGLARDRRAVQGVDLLRLDARHGGRLVLRVAGGDRHLGAERVLALAHPPRDALGELLGLEAGLVDDHLADDVVDDLLEARHVRALLLRTEIHEAFEVRGEQLGVAVGLPDADHLLDAGDADAGERDVDGGGRRLDVGLAGESGGLHGLWHAEYLCAFTHPPWTSQILVLSLTHPAASHLRRSVRGTTRLSPSRHLSRCAVGARKTA
jgi:hypothetical protein